METMWQSGSSALASGSWRAWLATGGALLARDVVALASVLGVWQERMRQRRQLAGLDERSLADMGLSRAEVFEETAKPFWRA